MFQVVRVVLAHSKQRQGRKLESGTKAEAMEEQCLLAHSHNPGPLARDGTSSRGLGPPMSIISQENALNTCLRAHLVGHCLE